MPRYWICPNCGTRAIDDDGRDGLSHQQVGCAKCGFGFLFELLEDFYPPANAGFLACDKDTRVISCGKGVFDYRIQLSGTSSASHWWRRSACPASAIRPVPSTW